MTVVFAGTELDAFEFFGQTFATTTSSRRDPNFSRHAVRTQTQGFTRIDFPALTEGWLHFTVNLETILSGNQDKAWVSLIDTVAGKTVLQIDGDNGVWNLEHWNGVALTELPTNLIISNDVIHRIDMHWKIANSGIFEVYIDGVFITSFEGDTLEGVVTQVDQVIFRPTSKENSSLFNSYISEVIVSTVETIGWRLATLTPDGPGNSTTWTGDDTDVVNGFPNDTTFISSGTAEEVEQFTVTDLSVTAAALDIEAVVVAARSRNAITGPQNIQLGVRTGGSDFFGSTITASTGFTPAFEVFNVNPDTGQVWTTSEVNALEIGVKSKP